MSDQRRALGVAGEAMVAAWYEAAGYEVLDRNWRCREGELDLVVGRDHVIVFCEVKTRRSDAFGAPVEAVTAQKQRRLRVLAVQWLDDRGRGGALRFDVASVRPGRGQLEVEVLEDAF
ncbi:MAG: YraN family protein [Actinobacteria bacterium]|nr:YraN family protein [Actinomycetota bacterium]